MERKTLPEIKSERAHAEFGIINYPQPNKRKLRIIRRNLSVIGAEFKGGHTVCF